MKRDYPLNKLAILAFALLFFFSTMLWYLANGSLNDYLKSQVLLQSEYYSGQQSHLVSADFSNNTGIATFKQLSLNNLEGLTQSHVLKIDEISAQLAKVPTQQLSSPSIQKKTTTLVHITELRLSSVNAWSELTDTGETNLVVYLNKINTQLATDYPALYPQISAKLYAKEHPELNEAIALASLEQGEIDKKIETNQAIIASKAAKKKKRLLGKATTRVKISEVIIDDLMLTMITGNKEIERKSTAKNLKNISLGSFGGENGLASNQLGGELLKQLLSELISIEETNRVKE